MTASLERRLAAAEQLIEVAEAVGGEASVPDALDALFETFKDLVPYDRMEYAAITDGGKALVTRWVRATYRPLVLDVGFEYRRSPAEAESSDFVSGGSAVPYIETDTLAYSRTKPPHHPSHFLLAEGIRSGLCCPLIVEGRRTGYLFFCSRTPDAYDDLHLWAMTRIAGVASGAILTAELRDELAARNRELEELTQFRTRYLAMVSHELRTPLTAVVGLAQSMREGFEGFSREELRELVELLAEQSSETASIVEDLLLLAKAESGRLEVAREEIDLGALAHSVASGLDPAIRVEGSGAGVGDAGRVRQIVRNLLSNARKYGGPDVAIEVTSDRGMARLSVSDDGPGIPEGQQDSIYQPFASTRSRPDSTGIGLWVSSELARRMDGSLSYERSHGRSRFTLSLPAPGTTPAP